MGKYTKYAKNAEKAIKETFEAIRKAEAEHIAASEKQEAFKRKHFDSEIDRQYYKAQADADYLRTQKELIELKKRLASETRGKLQSIREELTKQIEADFALKPDKMDSNTITLLESGVLNAKDYNDLMQSAISDGNTTMIKLIASYADKRAHDTALDPHERQMYITVANNGNNRSGAYILDNYDALGKVFDRTMNNTRLIDNWDTLMSPIVESL